MAKARARPLPAPAPAPGPDAELRAAWELAMRVVRGRRLIWQLTSRRLAEHGQSMSLWQVASHLRRHGPCNQRELAEAIGQHPAGVSRVLEEMVGLGFLGRERKPEDRRQSVVSLAPAGEDWYARMHPVVMAAVLPAIHRLKASERRTLTRLLDTLLAAGSEE